MDDGTSTETLRLGAGPPRPNIVFFLVDDMGWQDTSEPFYYDASGNPVITPLNQRYRTPNMEVLADRGMKFTNAYAMPVCTPTRNCWITGQNSARHHVTNWTNPAGTETGNNTTTSHNSPASWIRGGLPQSHPTLPFLLQEAGYRTIHAGKAHFGATAYAKEPHNIGFDVNIAGSEIGHPGSYTGNYGQGGSRPVPGLEEYHNTGTFLTEALSPYLRADPGTHRPQELLIHFPHDHRTDYYTVFREDDWKLIYEYASNSYELYNLANDISESSDLSATEPERVMTMSRKMARQLDEACAQWPTFDAGLVPLDPAVFFRTMLK